MNNYFRESIEAGINAAKLGVITNCILSVIKIIAGVLGNSYALIADGIESVVDVVLSVVVWRGLRVSAKDANEKYHFGYGKAESLSAAAVAIFILGAAISIIVVSIREILTPHHLPAPFTLFILILVVITKELLARKVSRVGESVDSVSIKGDAVHHRADAITSGAAFMGILIAVIGGPGWEAADDYAAVFCGLIIAHNGYSILRQALKELMDRAPDNQLIEQIKNAALSIDEKIIVEKIMARKSGIAYFVGLHVHADPNMTLHDSHIVSGKVKTAIKRALPAVRDVLVHMEPIES